MPLAEKAEKDQCVLRIRDLRVSFSSERGEVRSVEGVSFHIDAGETLGVVGESGSGKSVTALSVMQLIPVPPGRYVGGEILFEDTDLLKLKDKKMRGLRGNKISMIYQEPMTSLNPVFSVGDQIAEAIALHQNLPRRQAFDKAIDMLRHVNIPAPERRAHEYPHQLSGGMRQRVMIAMALACNPKLLIADEPTTALDVTIQAQILELMRKLRDESGMAIMLITHDLGVVAQMCDRVVVMYSGRIVEEADVYSLFDKPLHPYTQDLLKSNPQIDGDQEELYAIEGATPNPWERGPGCAFAPRCRHAFDRCSAEIPALTDVGNNRKAACFLVAEEISRCGATA